MNPLTDDDRAALQAIFDSADDLRNPHAFVEQMYAYYHDMDRANRTPRSSMYLHLGMCCGLIERLLKESGKIP
jgi:hypothetical protein